MKHPSIARHGRARRTLPYGVERVEKIIGVRRKNEGGNTSMQGQLGHCDENAELKDADSDLAG
jgi:hypothetical protein